jgi:serine/threonine protein kinase
MTDSVSISIQSGGKMIGQGAYGCIFSPPLLCRGEKKPRHGWKSNKLGKMTEFSDIKNEINAAKALAHAPNVENYCILPEIETLCNVSPMTTQREKDLSKCDALKKYSAEDMMQYELEYGGKTLKTRLDTTELSTSFPFFDFMGQILEIGAFLALHGCIHNDMHSSNIVMKKDLHPRLIDFGRSYMYNNINAREIEEISGVYYNPALGQIPPEVTAHHGVNEGVPVDTIIADLDSKKSGLLHAERILGVSRKEQLAEFKQFWLSSRSVQKGDWVQFYKLYWPVVDSWAIGHNLVGILRRLVISKQFTESKEWLQKQSVVKTVLKGLLHASPKRRLDAIEALAMYDPMNALVSSSSGKDWLEKKGAHPQS